MQQSSDLDVRNLGSSEFVRRSDESSALAAWHPAWLSFWMSNVGRNADAADIALFRRLLDIPEEAVRACLRGCLEYSGDHGAYNTADHTHKYRTLQESPFNLLSTTLSPPNTSTNVSFSSDPSTDFGSAQHAYQSFSSHGHGNDTSVDILDSDSETQQSVKLSKHASRGKEPCNEQNHASFTVATLDPIWSTSTVTSGTLSNANKRVQDLVAQIISRRAATGCGRIRGHESQHGKYPCTLACGRRFKTSADAFRHEEIVYPQQFFFCSACGDPTHPSEKYLFTREDKMRQHLKRSDHANVRVDQCKVMSTRTLWPERCGLCTHHRHPTWKERCRHIIWHCKRGDYDKNNNRPGTNRSEKPVGTAGDDDDDAGDDDDGDEDANGDQRNDPDGAGEEDYGEGPSNKDRHTKDDDHDLPGSGSYEDFFEGWLYGSPGLLQYPRTIHARPSDFNSRKLNSTLVISHTQWLAGHATRPRTDLDRIGLASVCELAKQRQCVAERYPSSHYQLYELGLEIPRGKHTGKADPLHTPLGTFRYTDQTGEKLRNIALERYSQDSLIGPGLPNSHRLPLTRTVREAQWSLQLDKLFAEVFSEAGKNLENCKSSTRVDAESPRQRRRREWHTEKIEARRARQRLGRTNSGGGGSLISPWSLFAESPEPTLGADSSMQGVSKDFALKMGRASSITSFAGSTSRSEDHVRKDDEEASANQRSILRIDSSFCSHPYGLGFSGPIEGDKNSGVYETHISAVGGGALDATLDHSVKICGHCSAEFCGRYQRGNWARHVRQNHPETGAQVNTDCVCRVCKQQFRRQDARRKHEWKKHGMEDTKPLSGRSVSHNGTPSGQEPWNFLYTVNAQNTVGVQGSQPGWHSESNSTELLKSSHIRHGDLKPVNILNYQPSERTSLYQSHRPALSVPGRHRRPTSCSTDGYLPPEIGHVTLVGSFKCLDDRCQDTATNRLADLRRHYDHLHGRLTSMRPKRNSLRKPVVVIDMRPTHPKIMCPFCPERTEGFRGSHELDRHIARSHANGTHTRVGGSCDRRCLGSCQHSRHMTSCGAYYNAAAHLRRAHFHPRKTVSGGICKPYGEHCRGTQAHRSRIRSAHGRERRIWGFCIVQVTEDDGSDSLSIIVLKQ